MLRSRRLLLVGCAFAVAGGVALAAGPDGGHRQAQPPTLDDCVRDWNGDSVAGTAGAPVWRSLQRGALVTLDGDGRCVVALDGSACGASRTHALAWTLIDGAWAPSRGSTGEGADDRRTWMQRIQTSPNARLISERGTIRLGAPRGPVPGLGQVPGLVALTRSTRLWTASRSFRSVAHAFHAAD